LEAALQGLEGLPVGDFHVALAAEAQLQFEQFVLKQHAENGDGKLAAIGEVDLGLPAGRVFLLKEDLSGVAVEGPPFPDPSLQSPKLGVLDLAGPRLLQVVQDGGGLKHLVLVALEQWHHGRSPDLVQWVSPGSPGTGLTRFGWQVPGLPFSCSLTVHANGQGR